MSGRDLRDKVTAIGRDLGLKVETEVPAGRRIWGAQRQIDVVFEHPTTHLSLGIECKYQHVRGTAEERVAATLEDIRVWPIRGIVAYSGDSFSQNMESYLLSTGMAAELSDLRNRVELYFGL